MGKTFKDSMRGKFHSGVYENKKLPLKLKKQFDRKNNDFSRQVLRIKSKKESDTSYWG